MYYGYQVLENPNLVKQEVHKVHKSWAQKVMEWNPCNVEFIKPDYDITYIPDREVYIMKDKGLIVCHPEVAIELRKTIKRDERPYQGGIGLMSNFMA